MNEMIDNGSDDENLPQLSVETFNALQEFLKEEESKEAIAVTNMNPETSEVSPQFPENWQLSQFWYDEGTVEHLVKVSSKVIPKESRIALISCPTLFKPMKNYFSYVKLFEVDPRFQIFGSDYVFYNYKDPLLIPKEFKHSFDLVVADPPFLSEECVNSTAMSMKFLSKDKMILCTGSTLKDFVKQLLDLDETYFKPCHRSNLANEFSCYSNFPFEY